MNDTKKECIQLNNLSNDLNVHWKLLKMFKSVPVHKRMFDNCAAQDVVNSVVGRWSSTDLCSIVFHDVNVGEGYTKLDRELLQALFIVSMLNYGITFTESEEDCMNKMEEWYKDMNNTREKKRKYMDTIQLSCSLDDIYEPTEGTKYLCAELCTELCAEFAKKNKRVFVGKVPFEGEMMSDEFVKFFKNIVVFPGQLSYENMLSLKKLKIHFGDTFGEEYELPDGVAIDSEYDLSHDYFEKEVYFKKDVVLKHSTDVGHRFSLLQLKSEKLKLRDIIQVIAEFGNTGRYAMIEKEQSDIVVEDEGDGYFNMYESISEEGKKHYDMYDREGLSKKTLDVHIWVVRM